MEKYTSVGNRQRLQVISLHPGVCHDVFEQRLGLTRVLSGGQVVTPEFFPMLVMGRRWSFLTRKKRSPPDWINKGCRTSEWVRMIRSRQNRLPLPDDATDPAALSYGRLAPPGVALIMYPTFLKLRSMCNMIRHRLKEGGRVDEYKMIIGGSVTRRNWQSL